MHFVQVIKPDQYNPIVAVPKIGQLIFIKDKRSVNIGFSQVEQTFSLLTIIGIPHAAVTKSRLNVVKFSNGGIAFIIEFDIHLILLD